MQKNENGRASNHISRQRFAKEGNEKHKLANNLKTAAGHRIGIDLRIGGGRCSSPLTCALRRVPRTRIASLHPRYVGWPPQSSPTAAEASLQGVQMLAVSPDGMQLALIEYVGSPSRAQLLILAIDGGEPRELLAAPGYYDVVDWHAGLSWLPDGSGLLYGKIARQGSSAVRELWCMSVADGGAHKIDLALEGGVWDVRLHRAADERSPLLVSTGAAPLLDVVREERRFRALERRLGLADA